MIKTYNISTGTIGFVNEDEKKMEFPTDEEATEYIREEQQEDEDQN